MRGGKLLLLLIPLMFLAFAIPKKAPPDDDLQFSPPTDAQTVPATAPALELPCVARGSELLVEKIVSYEGDFWEDGTNAYAVNIAALVVYNPGPLGVRKAEIVIRQGQRQLAFHISYLPPGSRVLVQERHRNAYVSGSLTQCSCTLLEKADFQNAAVSAESTGRDGLLLKNETGNDFSSVTVHYKQYDEAFGMYLGGISYPLTAAPLASGESLQIDPIHYTDGHSRIVLIEAE